VKLILIPGLGYDHRIFEKLSLDELDVEYLDWIEPEKNERIKDYANRLFLSCQLMDNNLTIVGHSFGGIIAQEIAAIHKIKKVILLSSIVSRREFPIWLKICKALSLHKLPIRKLSSFSVKIWGQYHGFDTAERIILFKSMVNKYSDHYFYWAVKELSEWKGVTFSGSTEIFQIHGTKDLTFPIKRIQNPNYIVENGNHVFMLDQPDISNRIIKNEAQQSI